MPTEPSAEELAFARRWAAAQSPPVTVEPMSEAAAYIRCVPHWLVNNMGNLHPSADAAWSALALALRPIRASLGPVIAEEERLRIVNEQIADARRPRTEPKIMEIK